VTTTVAQSPVTIPGVSRLNRGFRRPILTMRGSLRGLFGRASPDRLLLDRELPVPMRRDVRLLDW
jgi:hypothetical protein